jgi:microcystin degradation protein MlrC
MKPRILYAGLFHETHTFIRELTPRKDFEVTLGPDILGKRGDDSPCAGFLEVADREGWEVIPTIHANAVPSGTATDDAFDYFWREFETRAAPALAAGVDGIFVVLHGAMVTETIDDPEGEFLQRLRALPGAADRPIFGVLDLHANVTPRMCQLADCLVTYRENPHTDAKIASGRAAGLLARALRERVRPRMHWCRVPVIWAPPGTGTANEPMVSLNLAARKIESMDPGVWACNVAPGFSFADTADSGVTLSLCYKGDEKNARRHLKCAADIAWKLRTSGNIEYPSVDEVLAKIPPDAPGPILLVEPSDNIGAGSPGDCTGILRAFVEKKLDSALICIADPLSVAALDAARVGETATLEIGGRGSPLDPGPVRLEVQLISRSTGHFDLEDPQSHLASMSGRHYHMGPCAVVRHRGLTILLTSKKTPPFDLGQYRSQGIEPKSFRFIGVKAAVAHRRAYDPITKASYYVDTPGPCSSDLSRFPFKKLLRPVYPLDAGTVPEYLFA